MPFSSHSVAFDAQNGRTVPRSDEADDVTSIEPSLHFNWLQMAQYQQQRHFLYDGFSPGGTFAQWEEETMVPPPLPLVVVDAPPSSRPPILQLPTVYRQTSAGAVIPSAYALFFRDIQRQVRDELSTDAGEETVNFGEVSRAVAKRWAQMSRTGKAVYRLHVQRLKRARIRESALCRVNELLAQRWEKH